MRVELKRPAWIEIDFKALEKNYNFIRSRIDKKTKIAAVVKANAYGHGAAKIAPKLSQLGVEYFCVSSPDEGIELRRAGIKKPILVLAEVLETQYSEIVKGDLTQAAASLETISALDKLGAKAKKKVKVHLVVDTGMGRIGFFPDQLNEAYQLAKKLKNIKIDGIFSHLARADEKDKTYSYQQLQKFNSALDNIRESGFKLPLIHIGNSAAIIDLKESFLDLNNETALTPILSFKTRVVQLRQLSAGSAIGYGSTYKTENKEKLAVLPIGYKDGYPRLLSNQGEVLINGQRAPIRGRVCMGQTIVSVDHIKNVEVGDEVVLIGKQGEKEISAAEIAEICGTINYEIVCNLSERLEKIYVWGKGWNLL